MQQSLHAGRAAGVLPARQSNRVAPKRAAGRARRAAAVQVQAMLQTSSSSSAYLGSARRVLLPAQPRGASRTSRRAVVTTKAMFERWVAGLWLSEETPCEGLFSCGKN